MGRRRPPAETWPSLDVQRRQAATVERWTSRCATGAPLTPGEAWDMRDDWQRDQPRGARRGRADGGHGSTGYG